MPFDFDGECQFLRSEHGCRTAFTDDVFDLVWILILMVWIRVENSRNICARHAMIACSITPDMQTRTFQHGSVQLPMISLVIPFNLISICNAGNTVTRNLAALKFISLDLRLK